MGRRGCASAMGMIKFPSSCSSPKALCNQFIDYYICSRGVFCINHIKLRNFVVITIECSIATVDRGSIMTRIYRWSMMVYSSQCYCLYLEFDHIDCHSFFGQLHFAGLWLTHRSLGDVISEHMTQVCEHFLWNCPPANTTRHLLIMSTLATVMTWCHQARNHQLS